MQAGAPTSRGSLLARCEQHTPTRGHSASVASGFVTAQKQEGPAPASWASLVFIILIALCFSVISCAGNQNRIAKPVSNDSHISCHPFEVRLSPVLDSANTPLTRIRVTLVNIGQARSELDLSSWDIVPGVFDILDNSQNPISPAPPPPPSEEDLRPRIVALEPNAEVSFTAVLSDSFPLQQGQAGLSIRYTLPKPIRCQDQGPHPSEFAVRSSWYSLSVMPPMLTKKPPSPAHTARTPGRDAGRRLAEIAWRCGELNDMAVESIVRCLRPLRIVSQQRNAHRSAYYALIVDDP